VLLAAGFGAVFMVLIWKFSPVIKNNVFPERTMVGIVGTYPANELPLFIQKYISAGFTQIAENGEAVPHIASRWEVSKEGTLYFFYLTQNSMWHDGQELTAYDVNYNFRDVTIAPADRYTLKIELEDPFSPLPTLLSRPLFKHGLVGLGPYKVVQLEQSGDMVKTLILQKVTENSIQTDIKYSTDLIEFRFYPSIEAAVLAFKLGEIDHIEDLSTETELEHEQNVSLEKTVIQSKVLALFYNQQDELLGSKEFRQALSYATPTLEGEQVFSSISKTSWAYNENSKHYDNNPEKAKELFEKANLDKPSVTLSVFPEYLETAELIASSWREFGIEVQVLVIRSFPPEYQILLGVQEIPSDPDQYQLWHSTQQITNITHYNNPKIDKLLEEGRTLQTKEERLDVYKEFQRYIVEDCPAHFLIHPTTYTISRS
jgi:peptide/nickel transport system substrate-binding protein